MAKHVASIDTTRYKTIGPLFYDVPGAAITGRLLLSMPGAMQSVLGDVFEGNPSVRPADYDEHADDLVFEETKLEENTPRESVGRYTFLVGYVPEESVEPSTASHEGDAEPKIR